MPYPSPLLDCVWNVMVHAQKPDFVFRRNGRIHLNRRRRQFSLLLAAEVRASAVVMLDTPCSEVVWRVLATHSVRQFPLYFPSRASPCAITFQLVFNIVHFSKKSAVIMCLRYFGFIILRVLKAFRGRWKTMSTTGNIFLRRKWRITC